MAFITRTMTADLWLSRWFWGGTGEGGRYHRLDFRRRRTTSLRDLGGALALALAKIELESWEQVWSGS